jgi:hypothetical protein
MNEELKRRNELIKAEIRALCPNWRDVQVVNPKTKRLVSVYWLLVNEEESFLKLHNQTLEISDEIVMASKVTRAIRAAYLHKTIADPFSDAKQVKDLGKNT